CTAVGTLLLVCRSHEGFKNLSRLVTHYQLHGKPSPAILDSLSKEVTCLADTDTNLMVLKEVYGEEFYVKLTYWSPSRAQRIAREKGLKTIACPSVGFPDQHDFEKHRLLRAIDGGCLLDNLPASEHADKEEFLKEPQWYGRFFSSFPGAIKNNRELAEQCSVTFPQTKNILPNVEIDGDHFERLKAEALAGLREKMRSLSGRYLSRLEYELSVIRRTGFVDYFLIVGEIIDFCRRESIAAVGRGSAAGSLVSYSLGITQVDPLKEGLYFERFLNEARSDCPDVDLDIDWRKRDDVLNFIYKRYGDEHVAMMASYIHFQPRLAVRESAKALGLPPEDISRLVNNISRHPLERNDFPSKLPQALKNDWQRFGKPLEAARSIYGLPRHLGIHAGGIVITPEPITDYIPLERATKGIIVTQCDMYQAEKVGLVKIDILGQRGLAVIADCHKALQQIEGAGFRIPENDAKTYQTIRSGKTIGVFQIESPGMRALLRDLRPTRLNDITLALALIRPGASDSGMKKIFLDRFHGREKTAYPHDSLADVLVETCGVFIYQEQVILAAQKIAGFNLAASDLLRRAITKKRKEADRGKLGQRFLDGARKNAVDEETARNVFSQLRQFASFGFCKAHAATYGYLAYQSAYFKTHYPGIFMAEVLKNGGGYYPSAVYVAEARRLGVKVLPPDVNRSETSDGFHHGSIYLGNARVRDITRKTLRQIERCRPFESLADFLSKVDLSERETENLIKVGFFDSIETSRPKLLWQYRLLGKGNGRRKTDLFGGKISAPRMDSMPELTPLSRFEVFAAERRILDVPASFHPLTLFGTYTPVSTADLFQRPNESPVTISGWLADRKRIKTRDGKSMVFLTFDALDDTFEVVLFPDVYTRHRETLTGYRYLTIEGYLNVEDGNSAIVAQRLYPCPTGLKEARYI
ncbi:MAG: DNA polymerase III subunit alpha, partial [Candidatus Zixiibacteriota bacterium]